MKIKRAFTAVLTAVLVLVNVFFINCYSVEKHIVNDSSLTISYRENDIAIAGAEFKIYLIADVTASGEILLREQFEKYGVDISADSTEAWLNSAFTLEGYLLRDSVPPLDSGVTDENGNLTFDNLESGLYLVVGERYVYNGLIYTSKPFMVNVMPSTQNNVSPKCETKPEDDNRKVTLKVLKVWTDDNSLDRPEFVEIQLLRDGEIYETVKLSDINNWRNIWENLSDNYSWNVVEANVEGYTVEITLEGITFLVENTIDTTEEPTTSTDTPEETTSSNNSVTKPDSFEKPDDRLPQTGQHWTSVFILATLGLLFIVLGLISRRGAKNEE